MKGIISLFFLAIAVLVVLFPNPNFNINNYLYYSVCDQPVRYKIDTVDKRFNLGRDEFVYDVKKAEAVWEGPSGKNLFDYDQSGALSINLIYDSRQSLNNQITSLENNLKKGETDLKTQQAEFDRLKANFEQKLKAFNAEVEYFNSQGGAPASEFDKLVAEQTELGKEASQLNSLAAKLNLGAADYNSQASVLNKTVDRFNTALANRPEEGIYSGSDNRIEIYFNISRAELIHTLAHEMGHSLGIGHTNDPQGIMYPYTTQTTTLTSADQVALKSLCRPHSIFEGYIQRVELLFTKKWLFKSPLAHRYWFPEVEMVK